MPEIKPRAKASLFAALKTVAADFFRPSPALCPHRKPGATPGMPGPMFDMSKCTFCSACVKACPCVCLKVVPDESVIVAGARCISCGECAAACEYKVISMRLAAPISAGCGQKEMVWKKSAAPASPGTREESDD